MHQYLQSRMFLHPEDGRDEPLKRTAEPHLVAWSEARRRIDRNGAVGLVRAQTLHEAMRQG